MSTSATAKTEFESGQTAHSYTLMTDSGDHQVHTVTGGTVYSNKAGYEPTIRPNGIVTGRNLLSTHASTDTVTVAAFSAYSIGISYDVSADTAVMVRPAASKYNVNSVTMDSSGAISVVTGTDGDSFSDVRGADGAAPYIPEDSVEIGQVKLDSDGAAIITSDEVFQSVGTHTERFDFPVWNTNSIGDGDTASIAAKKNAYIEFASELGAIHTAGAYKRIYVSWYAPVFAELSRTLDFVPVENSHSVTSTQYYNGTVGSVASTLGQGSFTALMTDNVTDALVGNKDQVLTIRFYPDRNKVAYILTQGKLGIARTFPVAGQNQASVTVSADTASAEFSG